MIARAVAHHWKALISIVSTSLLIGWPAAANNIVGADAATGLGSALSAGQSGADLGQQMQRCQQKQSKTPPEPCNPELQKAGQDAGQIGQSLGELMKALGQMASAMGKGGGGGPYDSAFQDSNFSFDEPERLETALKGIGASDREIRDVFKAKETLDEAEKSGFLNNPASQAAMSGAEAAPLSSSGLEQAQKEFEEIKKRAENAIAQNFPHIGSGAADGGGGASNAFAAAGGTELTDTLSSEDPFKLDIPPPQHRTAAGDPLAPPTSDIFQTLSRRYQIRQTAGQFLP